MPKIQDESKLTLATDHREKVKSESFIGVLEWWSIGALLSKLLHFIILGIVGISEHFSAFQAF